MPDLPPILVAHEAPWMEEVVPAATKELDNNKSRLVTPLRSLYVDTLFQIRQTSLRRENQSYWHMIIMTTSCALAVPLIDVFTLRSRFRRLFLCNITNNPSESHPVPQASPLLALTPEHTTMSAEKYQSHQNVTFTTSYLQLSIYQGHEQRPQKQLRWNLASRHTSHATEGRPADTRGSHSSCHTSCWAPSLLGHQHCNLHPVDTKAATVEIQKRYMCKDFILAEIVTWHQRL